MRYKDVKSFFHGLEMLALDLSEEVNRYQKGTPERIHINGEIEAVRKIRILANRMYEDKKFFENQEEVPLKKPHYRTALKAFFDYRFRLKHDISLCESAVHPEMLEAVGKQKEELKLLDEIINNIDKVYRSIPNE